MAGKVNAKQDEARRKPWHHKGAWFYVDTKTCSFYVDGYTPGVQISTKKLLYALQRAGLATPTREVERGDV